MEDRRKVHEVWKEQLPSMGLQGTIKSENTSLSRQCKPETSPEEEEV